MAVDNRFVYGVEIDLAQARRAASQLKKIFDNAMTSGGDKKVSAALAAQQIKITAITKSNARQREALARAEGQVKVIEARKAAQQVAELERRKTATHKSELQKRERAERQSGQRVTNAQRVTNQAKAVGGLAVGGLAALGVTLGAREVAQQTVELSRLRTEVLRSNVAFETLSGGEAQAAKNLKAVQEASGGTIDELQAQQIATQALTLHLAKGEEGLARVVRAGRLIATVSPVIHDASNAMSELGLAAANVSFRRADQLGLSVTELKDRMAELQDANDELSDSEAYLEAALQLVDEKFGDIADSAAYAAGGAETLAASWNTLKQSLAEGSPGEAADRALVNIAFAIDLYSGKIDDVEKANEALAASQKLGVDGSDQLRSTIEAMNSAIDNGVAGADKYAETIKHIANEAIYTGQVTDDQAATLARIEEWYGRAAYGAGVFAASQYDLADAISAANAAATNVPSPVYSAYELAKRGRIGDIGVSNRDDLSDPYLSQQGPSAYEIRQERVKNELAIVDAAEKEWASAAKETAKSWESEITGALKSVPGLFDSSEVTQGDIDAAEAGTYQEKADEYLRQLRDEVLNGKDYEGVDIRDAAERAGIDPSLPVEEIFRQFEEAWNDSSLFADGLNLDLINTDAVQAAIDKEKKSGKGEAAILSYFSQMYGPEVAQSIISGGSTGPGGITPEIGGEGGPTANDGILRVNKVILARDAVFDTEDMPDFAGAFIPALYDSIFHNEQAVADLNLIGGAVAGAIYTGFNAKLPEYNWVSGILSTAQGQAAQQILDSLNAAILPNG